MRVRRLDYKWVALSNRHQLIGLEPVEPETSGIGVVQETG